MGLLLYIALFAALGAPSEADARLSGTDQYNQSMAWHTALPKEAKAAAMEAPGRLAELSANELLPLLDLKAGMWALDVGAGSGYFTLAMGKAVGPTGRVFASDVDPAMLDLVRARFSTAGLSNLGAIKVSYGAQRDNPYDGLQLDLVLMNSVVDVVPSVQKVFADAAQVLKPGGRLVVVHPRLYTDFSASAELPCGQVRASAGQAQSGVPLEAHLKAQGLTGQGQEGCPPGALAAALNSLISDPTWDPAVALGFIGSREGRGVARAALLQRGAAAGKPRPGVLRVLAWYVVVSHLGLEQWAWKNALGRGIYLSREALAKVGAGAGLHLERSQPVGSAYWALVFRRTEAR